MVFVLNLFLFYTENEQTSHVLICLQDFFRAITGSLTLLITSIICISWAFASSGEVAGSVSKLAKNMFLAERVM